jgi:general secretion pathway protein J
MELLMAMSILAIMVTLLMGVFRVGYRAWDKGDAVIASMQRLRAVLGLVRHQLTAAVAAPPVAEGEMRFDFIGTGTALRFVSTRSLVPGEDTGQVLVNYRADLGSDGLWRLRFHEQSLLRMGSTPAVDPAPGDYRELIGGLAGVRFEYLTLDESTGEPVWADRWDEEAAGSLPKLVRFWVQPEAGQVPMAVAARLVSTTEEE